MGGPRVSAPLIWFVLGSAFFLAELMTPALVLLFFGVGAWAAACAALLDLTLSWQLMVFILVSVLTLLVLRRRLRAVFGGRSHKAGNNDANGNGGQPLAHPLTGRQGVVSKALHPGQVGEVSIDGSFWRAVADTHISRDRAVRVLGTLPADGLMLRVAAVEESRPEQPEFSDPPLT